MMDKQDMNAPHAGRMTEQVKRALELGLRQLYHDGISTEPAHPKRVAATAMESALAILSAAPAPHPQCEHVWKREWLECGQLGQVCERCKVSRKVIPEHGCSRAVQSTFEDWLKSYYPQATGETVIALGDAFMFGRDSAAPQPQDWIDLNDRMPEPEVYVLTWDGKKVGIDWWGSLRHRGDGVTHWLPFPKPPGAGDMFGMHSLAAPVAAQPAIKDHLIAQAVNELRYVAVKFHATQQLRDWIARIAVPLARGDAAELEREIAAARLVPMPVAAQQQDSTLEKLAALLVGLEADPSLVNASAHFMRELGKAIATQAKKAPDATPHPATLINEGSIGQVPDSSGKAAQQRDACALCKGAKRVTSPNGTVYECDCRASIITCEPEPQARLRAADLDYLLEYIPTAAAREAAKRKLAELSVHPAQAPQQEAGQARELPPLPQPLYGPYYSAEEMREYARAAQSAPAVSEGWKLVPLEADDDMVSAACEAANLFRVDAMRAIEAAIAAAAPAAQKGEKE